MNDETHVFNIDPYESIEIHWVHCIRKLIKQTYFHRFGAEHITEGIKTFIRDKI